MSGLAERVSRSSWQAILLMMTSIVGNYDARGDAQHTQLFVDDPDRLAAIESQLRGLGGILCGDRAAKLNTAELAAACQPYFDVARGIDRELQAEQREAISHRWHLEASDVHFDRQFLRSSNTQFQLVGVVARPDEPASPASRACGELRLIFRLTLLAHPTIGPTAVPMTLMVVLHPHSRQESDATKDRGTCLTWIDSMADQSNRQVLALIRKGSIDRIEVNIQSFFTRSRYHKLAAGQAHYLMQTFSLQNQRFITVPLRNSPDVQRISLNQDLKAELRQWIMDNRAAIESGHYLLPEKFLTQRAVSISPHGMQRLANRPFRQIFSDEELAQLATNAEGAQDQVAMVLRRLDGLTCVGCHQSRSVAGFHFLGKPRGSDSFNRPFVAASPHFYEVQAWRQQELSAKVKAVPASAIPFPERSFAAFPAFSRSIPCTLSRDVSPSWDCPIGLLCRPHPTQSESIRDPIGLCQNPAIEPAQMCQGSTYRFSPNPLLDILLVSENLGCAGATTRGCTGAETGFPDGFCGMDCEWGNENFLCQKIPVAGPFDACLQSGAAFADCLAASDYQGLVQRCDVDRPCRDDYICGTAQDARFGACVPTYVLPQMSIEGL